MNWIRRPRKRSAAGHGPSQGAVCMPGGGYALPGLQTALGPPLNWIRRPRKRSAAGHGYSQGAACLPTGGYAIPGIQTALEPTIELDP
ncbi:hypothetical protein N8M48_18465 [Klebsiella pneumoniae]|uniref:hypothetical protein n=1 Tax=Klebsiella pneumoniae TaxID=573 RepID=UPI0021CF6F46|nr:hypothetical protein [Klebsiella pneumoniae]MCU6629312.1 hypothetical protein [Klebsiella pneumoniae]